MSRALQECTKRLRGFFHVVRRFVPLVFPYWDKVILRILCSQGISTVGVVSALATGKAIDEGLIARSPATFYFWAGLLVFFAVYNLVYLATFATVATYIRMRLDFRLKRLIFDHAQRLSLRFHEHRPVGENMYRINYDTVDATDIAGNTLPELLERIVMILTTCTLLFVLNPFVALLIATYVAIYYVYSHIVITYAYRLQKEFRRQAQGVSALLQQNFTAFPLSKAMARERHELRRYFGRLAGLARAAIRFGILASLQLHGGEMVREFLVTFVYMLLCSYFVITERMSVGEYVAMAGIIAMVTVPLQLLVGMIQRLRIAVVPAERMLDTLELDPEIKDVPQPCRLAAPKGEIAFENVSFRYTPNGPDVIKNLSFRVEPGKKLAIVGQSGAGKSSIFNLLMRYYDPFAGRILIDGADLREIALESYRFHVGIVLQENFLFSATIRDNILFGNIRASERELAKAVELAGLIRLAGELPEGLDTVLLEGGNLSAGQKQRIAIARAVIRDPRFLFLDEATSSLDPVTEHEILEQLRQIEPGRTRIVIAHRIASIEDADEILVMDRGLLVQQGAHRELVEVDGLYRRMWAAEREQGGRRGRPEQGDLR